MSVAFLTTGYPAPQGGAEGIFHRTLAEALVRAGAGVEVVAPLPRVPWPLGSLTRRWRRYATTPLRYQLGDVSVRRPRYWQVPNANYLGIRHQSFSRCLSEAVTSIPSVIHAHFAYPCGLAAVQTGSRWQVPVVLTLHGSDVNVLAERNRRTRRYFSKAVREATFVTAVSKALADRTERLAGRRPEVMPIGIDLRPYAELPDRRAAREALGLPSRTHLVLFVGALVEGKGVLLLREALEQLRRSDVLGIFVGEGPLRPMISNSTAARCVGAVSHDDVPMYMRAADVLVLPSFGEGMPTVLVEAGAAGLPVVASSVGGIGELLANERGFLIPPHDRDALIGALENALADPDRAADRAGRLQEYVGRAYNVDENARAMMKIYEGLL